MEDASSILLWWWEKLNGLENGEGRGVSRFRCYTNGSSSARFVITVINTSSSVGFEISISFTSMLFSENVLKMVDSACVACLVCRCMCPWDHCARCTLLLFFTSVNALFLCDVDTVIWTCSIVSTRCLRCFGESTKRSFPL